MTKANTVFLIFLIICLLMSSTVILTKPATMAEAFQLHIATLLWHIGGAVLFLLAIKGFRSTLKPAYRFMSIGASMLLLGVIQIYGLQLLHLDNHPVAKILTELPFIFMQTFFLHWSSIIRQNIFRTKLAC